LTKLIGLWTGLVTGRPGLVLALVATVTALSGVAASGLSINTNQLDLISDELQEVKDVKRIDDMIGGTGHLILALRGNDEAALKDTADQVNAYLKADKKRIREVTYRVSVEFLQRNAALFMQTPDLVELKKRVMTKLRDAIKRANPFFFEIKPTKPYELKVQDIIDKYTKIGQKSITDDYYISDDREMVLLLIKPMWNNNDLGKTGELVDELNAKFGTWTKDTKHTTKAGEGARKLILDHNYTPELEAANGKKNADGSVDPAKLPEDATVVEYGWSGSYKTNFDDSMDIKNSLAPVSGYAIAGVMLVLLFFFRGRVTAALILLFGLLIGVVVTMGFTWLAVGELNMITSILGAILMGFGIDFGIHQLFRLSEELDRGAQLDEALAVTIRTSGVASLVSALGTAAAFFSLMFSEFAGFAQFGLIASAGVFIIAIMIYLWVPSLLALLERRKPGTAAKVLRGLSKDAEKAAGDRRITRPALWLSLAAVAALVLASLAPKVGFELNTRALMVEDNKSVKLQDEINERYRISTDPVGIYSKDIADARKCYDTLIPTDPERFSTVGQVVSLFTFVPPADQQKRNADVLKGWRAELEELDRKSLPPDYDEKWDEVMKYLSAKPYTVNDLPDHIKEAFRHLPSTKKENHGVLTFIYAGVDLWDATKMMAFADEVRAFDAKDGTVFRAAGMAPLFSRLVRIILWDGKFSVGLTLVLLLLLLLVDFRSLKSALVALIPLVLGVGVMLGAMTALDVSLNLMNVVVFPIVLGYGVSHGVYLMHRFHEGSSPLQALRSVGLAVACSTVTTLAGWAALTAAAHRGLRSMGVLACIGMTATLVVTFTLMPTILQLLHDRRTAKPSE